MRLVSISIQNFRSIRFLEKMRIEPLQALVGENNSGKSNILRALKCFLSAGAGGVAESDFNEASHVMWIECEFGNLTQAEALRLRRYLINGTVILRKELRIATDLKGKQSIKAEYHGYQAEPSDYFLSLKKIEEKGKPDWIELARQGGFFTEQLLVEGKLTKAAFKAALEEFLNVADVPYDDAVLGQTQALGIPQNLLANLPELYLLPAITDYADEIDKRSNSTVFRRLMGDLSQRLLRVDPRYSEVDDAINKLRALLNPVSDQPIQRLGALTQVESKLKELVSKLMPSVTSVSLGVEIDQARDLFSRGVAIQVDDGALTSVLDKGNGLQRSLVFALLQMLIEADKTQDGTDRPILLAIEEPELYIHPHCQRLIFSVLKKFSGATDEGVYDGHDQVIYTTHSPAFVEIAHYDRIAVVRKASAAIGTITLQCAPGALGTNDERKAFKLLTSFGIKHNELFFAQDAILVEGVEDEIGLIAAARKLNFFQELPDEIGVSIVVTGGKGDVPKFQKVLNAFGLAYSVLLELDGKDENDKQSQPIIENLAGNRIAKVSHRVEDLLGIGSHFADQSHAKRFFSAPENINKQFEEITSILFSRPK
ncbi:MAG: AAA family ATPase [Polaromonas sp.]|nr:AAA family ATPase [Polaromonas sp.]MDP3753660.1 AAA family ATPase [Polaromonas sp.]